MKLHAILLVLSLLAVFSAATAAHLYYPSTKESAVLAVEKEAALHTESATNHLSSFLSQNLKSARALAGLLEMRNALYGNWNGMRQSLKNAQKSSVVSNNSMFLQ